ncbi:5-oxoprolinase-like [Ctenocephalides felis]|uniref:5-oxoprolinase-like n=1 Tax=Ctenocephalides felis TaxID=7515 RepID=UPI000E6E1996|nr:5-oxoprolinase-like [Ctenocephalides felis]
MAPTSDRQKFFFAIDRGGTFTDVLAHCPGGRVRTMKLLSEDPRYPDAPREGIRRILQEETGKAIDENGLIDTSLIGGIRMGTTVATNALLERTGEPFVLIVNKGFKDILHIGNQARPAIFELDIKTPSSLYKEVVEVSGRLVPSQPGQCLITNGLKEICGTAGNALVELEPLDLDSLRKDLENTLKNGIKSAAVVLAHSYSCPDHELAVGKLLSEMGFEHVTLSHRAMPMCRLVSRGFTACAEAYLTPHVERYLRGFRSGFRDQLQGVRVLFMQSDGGLTHADAFGGARAVLSGPAGGVVGYAVTGSRDTELPLIGFDMGGTSTDVSRYAGVYEHVVEATTAGVTIQAPQLDINTVAAGGGSMLFFRSGLFVVGPESAGAHPGPVCYRKGGPLTITDANLVLGRILPEYFPKIFGPDENLPLDKDASLAAFQKLTNEINEYLEKNGNKKLTVAEVALGFVRVGNEAMCRAIRALTQARGFDSSRHALAVFGGAGGQHACSVAAALGMGTVLVHKYAGILSAYGMALADVVHEAQEPSGMILSEQSAPIIKQRLDHLSETCIKKLKEQGFTPNQIRLEPYLHLRYEGTDCALMCAPKEETGESDEDAEAKELVIPDYGNFVDSFLLRYKSEFGFVITGRRIIVDDIRVRGAGNSDAPEESRKVVKEKPNLNLHFESGMHKTPVYKCEDLYPGDVLNGPSILIDGLSTILIEPECSATITERNDLIIRVGSGKPKPISPELDAIQLSIFSHRFMSIAEQMGRILQRTAISTNIKERLDFSCALFGPDGGLVSNAPHIPVHLGAMQETVQYQIRVRGDSLKEGQVLLSNHPQAGGSHLPDLTVITPVFHKGHKGPVFFVASRGHHADIGGITPGSMPPHSTLLSQEGAWFKSFLLVNDGHFDEQGLTERLMAPGKLPNSSGTRNLADNISDLKAQIAANHKGIQLVGELISYYGLNVVQAYMTHMQHNAEVAVRNMLKDIAKQTRERTGTTILHAEEMMDNGSKIKLAVSLDEKDGHAICDFNGTGDEVWGNCNAPRAITLSAIIYCLRCMVGHDVPLNQGCLAPISIKIPRGSLLDPSDDAAVVGGNVLTSQRVVDVVFKAFGTCAASQGCMNNITIGEETWGYYETVAGGSGAGPTWNGKSGVHTHMTNTRITDPEILELRYPIILKTFCLRPNSGGNGLFKGGDGVQRELLFRKEMTLSVLTERRVFQPYGMAGGEPGASGVNVLIRAQEKRKINLGAKTAIKVKPGDIFSMLTPGGGGYGLANDENRRKLSQKVENKPCFKTFQEHGSVFEYRMSQESV